MDGKKNTNQFSTKGLTMMRGTLTATAAIVASVMGLSLAEAASVSLTSGLNQAAISYGSTLTSGGTSATPLSGLYYLFRDGGGDKIQDAVQQTFFYRVGGSGSASEINTGTVATLNPVFTTANTARIDYVHSSFRMEVTYTLVGGGAASWGGTLNRSVRVVNTSGSDLNLSLFSYSDYTLTGVTNVMPTAGNPYVDNNIDPFIDPQNPNGFEFAQKKATGNGVRQWDRYGTNPTNISEMQTNYGGLNAPTAIEVSTAASLLGKLTGGSPDLTNTAGVVGGQNQDGTAIDVAFAAQWNLMLGAGKSATISEQSQVIPEPASLGLLALGAGLLAFPRRRNAR